MTRKEAINYMVSSGFSEEQINEIVGAIEENYKNHIRWGLLEFLNGAYCNPSTPKRSTRMLKEFMAKEEYEADEIALAEQELFREGYEVARQILYKILENRLDKLKGGAE